LKTRTTNDITAVGLAAIKRSLFRQQHTPRRVCAARYVSHQLATDETDPRHRSKKPIHNVKELPRRQIRPANWLPHSGNRCWHSAETPLPLVEPIGIEPMTSSLQS
jgi:hypothetical protein